MGTSRTASAGPGDLLIFDSAKEGAIDVFPWHKFENIIDCTGVIDYRNTKESIETNIEGNVIIPLSILNKLKKEQRYFYCSTHAVLIPKDFRTAYASSKLSFEERIMRNGNFAAKITIFRLPALFSETRKSGLIYKIKQHFLKKEKLELDIKFSAWHTMEISRAATIVLAIVNQGSLEKLITIGYPTETSLEKIIRSAEKVFDYKITISFIKNESDHYTPDISTQNKYVSVAANDFEKDLTAYFRR